MEIKKKDTNKIKTNPKYKCIDEGGSGGDDDEDMNNKEDFQALSSKELDFRETILKFEKKKRRKERKIKEREQKRIKALNGEDGNSIGTGDPSSTATPGISEDDDETHSKSSASSSDADSKDAQDEHGDRTSGKSSSIPKQEAGDGVSSVSSRQNKTERNHYILRTAIDEKYIPHSIKNLRYAANFVFLILLLHAIIYYVI